MSNVRPDIASSIEADHARLKALMAELADEVNAEVTAPEFAAWKVAFLWRLRDFENQLLKHFDLEEDGGFMTDLLRLKPQWAARIAQLGDEHAQIRTRLDVLIGHLKATRDLGSFSAPGFRREVHDLLDLIRAHEALECELIQSAYYQVYGAGD